MAKKYRVTLSEQEQAQLKSLIKKRSQKSVQVKRSYLLLAADENGEGLADEQISSRYQVGVRTIERLRERFVLEGLAAALQGKKQRVFKEKVFDGRVEAQLVALRCSNPPSGYQHWSMRLLAQQMVELQYVEHMSHESVRQVLKKTSRPAARLSPGK
jgi:transposase